MAKKDEESKDFVRDWLAGKSYESQYEFGIQVLKMFGVNIGE